MAQFFHIHSVNPQKRLIKEAAKIISQGGVIVYPTDSVYALGCSLENKEAAIRIRKIRGVGDDHNFTLVCRDLSEIAIYAKVDNPTFRLLKSLTPGPYTFLLNATKEVPKRLQHPKRKTIGIRVPDCRIVLDLLNELHEPIISSTLMLPNEEYTLIDPYEIYEILEHRVDLVIDGGSCGMEPTTVIDLHGDEPVLIRRGKGDVSDIFE